jgi:hypothetical protein
VSVGLYLSAFRRARPRQLAARALRPVNRRRSGRAPQGGFAPLEGPLELWRSRAFAPTGIEPGPERLRRFHALYDDDFEIREPPPDPDARHPYVVSTRAGNWIAAMSLRPELETPQVVDSLRRQLAFLAANVEDDVLGNHVIRNARALVLGGLAFGDDGLAEQGRDLLGRELREQVLADGGHYERSPVYHLVVLRDLLELRAAGETWLDGTVEAMRAFAAGLARPDGRPALFNDGGLDLAPELDLPGPPDGLSLFAETGYAVLRRGRVWLAFDCGPPAPDFLPAHAHADALSFQLWLDGRPVVVDPGTYTYEPGPDRDWFRSTRAHSTVTVDGRDQFRLWGSFRSGPLPRVELLEASPGALAGAVSYRGARHERRLELLPDGVRVHDRVDGRGRLLESRVPWAAEAPPGALLDAPSAAEEEARLSERFFEAVPTRVAVLRRAGALPGELGFRIGPGG